MEQKVKKILLVHGNDRTRLSIAMEIVYLSLLQCSQQSKIIRDTEYESKSLNKTLLNGNAAWLTVNNYKIGVIGYGVSLKQLEEQMRKLNEERVCDYLVCCSDYSNNKGSVYEFLKEISLDNVVFPFHFDRELYKHRRKIEFCKDVVFGLQGFFGIHFNATVPPENIDELIDAVREYISEYYSSEENKLNVTEDNAEKAFLSFNAQWFKLFQWSADSPRDSEHKLLSHYATALRIFATSVEQLPQLMISVESVCGLAALIYVFDYANDSRRLFGIKQILYQNLGVCWYRSGIKHYNDAVDAFRQSIFIMFTVYSNAKYPKVDAYGFRKVSKHFFESLIGDTLNVTSPYEFNDPFDTPILSLHTGDPIGELVKEAFRGTLKIACFSNNIVLPKPSDVTYEYGDIFKSKKKPKEFANPLMWAHYADNHKGVCIKYCFNKSFSVTGGMHSTIVTGFRDINYSNKALKNCGKSPILTMEDAFFLKGKAWEYENEIRFFCFDLNGKGIYDQYGDTSDCIEAVYFGLRCPEEDKKAIIQIFSCKNSSTSGTKKKKTSASSHGIKFFQIEFNEKKIGTFKARRLKKSEIAL